jgi:hypothetical protein
MRLTKGLREVSRCSTNHSAFLEGSSLMEFASQGRRGVYACQKGLNHVASLKNVLQVEVLTPHIALVQWPIYITIGTVVLAEHRPKEGQFMHLVLAAEAREFFTGNVKRHCFVHRRSYLKTFE